MVGYIGRINDRDLERIDEWDETANYKGSDYIGKVGVELSYERELHGTTGVEEVEVDAGGRAVRTLSRTPPIAGNDLRLSLDIQLQEVAEAAFGDRRGALVAIEPATGDVLAFVSKPGFDPNLFVDGIDTANWELLNESPDKPLLNRPLRGAYPPGSTIKPFLALGALTSGQAHADADDLRPRLLPAPRRGAPLPRRQDGRPRHASTCTSRSSRPATPTTTCSPARPTSTTPRASCRSSASASKTGIDIEGELTGVLPSREWKRQRFAGKNYREEHRKWYLGDSISAGHRPGLQRVHADPARARDRDHRQRRRRLPPAPREEHPRHCAPARSAQVAREPTHTVPLKPEHLAVIKNALVGVEQGRHQRGGVRARRRYVSAARPAPRRCTRSRARSTRRTKVDERLRDHALVHRLRAGRQAEDRARGAGRERRLRRAGRGADRAPGVRLLPDRRARRPGPRRRCRRSRRDAEDESD